MAWRGDWPDISSSPRVGLTRGGRAARAEEKRTERTTQLFSAAARPSPQQRCPFGTPRRPQRTTTQEGSPPPSHRAVQGVGQSVAVQVDGAPPVGSVNLGAVAEEPYRAGAPSLSLTSSQFRLFHPACGQAEHAPGQIRRRGRIDGEAAGSMRGTPPPARSLRGRPCARQERSAHHCA